MTKSCKSSRSKTKKFLGQIGRADEALFEMMLVLCRALEERDDATRGHSERVANLSCLIGERLGFGKTELEKLRRGALLHDIGKIGIPDEILFKPGNFTPAERARMNQHPEKGHLIILNCHLLWDLIPAVRNHHEHFDGSGYPDGLKGEQIPAGVRIISLADYFDALRTERPYKKALSKDEAVCYVRGKSGNQFDPKIVDIFLELVGGLDAENMKLS